MVAFLFSVNLMAQVGRESYKDIIEKAAHLSIQKERLSALSLLKNALKKEAKRSQGTKELQQALNDHAFIFYSEKAQQLHELALSMQTSDLNIALSKIKEATLLEPDNFSIEMAHSRILIAMGDCQKSIDRLQKYREYWTYVEELRMAAVQSFACLGKVADAINSKTQAENKNAELSQMWLSIDAEIQYRLGNLTKGLDLIQSSNLKKTNPEIYFWKWKFESELKMTSEKSGREYLTMCKSLSVRQKRDLLSEPNLCLRTQEVENYLKKMNNLEI